MLKIEDVKVGDELVCIDRDGFTQNETKEVNFIIANQENIIIESLSNTPIGKAINICGSIGIGKINTIFEAELKYFKKKEQSQQYTFNQLQDTAHKAVVDGVLSAYSVDFDGHTNYIKLSFDGKFTDYNDTCNDSGIRFIQSLYKETFVIASEEDLKKIGRTLDVNKVELTNGITLSSDDLLAISHYTNEFLLKLLKGATVEQERGRDD